MSPVDSWINWLQQTLEKCSFCFTAERFYNPRNKNGTISRADANWFSLNLSICDGSHLTLWQMVVLRLSQHDGTSKEQLKKTGQSYTWHQKKRLNDEANLDRDNTEKRSNGKYSPEKFWEDLLSLFINIWSNNICSLAIWFSGFVFPQAQKLNFQKKHGWWSEGLVLPAQPQRRDDTALGWDSDHPLAPSGGDHSPCSRGICLAEELGTEKMKKRGGDTHLEN